MTGAINQNLDLFAGDEILIKIPIKDAAGGIVPLPGARGFWFLESGLTALISKDETTGVVIAADQTTGVFTMSVPLTRADTQALAGVYRIRARIVDTNGRLITISSGQATIHPSPEIIP